MKKGIVCKACYFYSRTNRGIRLNPTVLATDLNGNMIEGRVRPFPNKGEEMDPKCYMIAYKRIDGEEVYFSPVQSIGIEENECRV